MIKFHILIATTFFKWDDVHFLHSLSLVDVIACCKLPESEQQSINDYKNKDLYNAQIRDTYFYPLKAK